MAAMGDVGLREVNMDARSYGIIAIVAMAHSACAAPVPVSLHQEQLVDTDLVAHQVTWFEEASDRLRVTVDDTVSYSIEFTSGGVVLRDDDSEPRLALVIGVPNELWIQDGVGGWRSTELSLTQDVGGADSQARLRNQGGAPIWGDLGLALELPLLVRGIERMLDRPNAYVEHAGPVAAHQQAIISGLMRVLAPLLIDPVLDLFGAQSSCIDLDYQRCIDCCIARMPGLLVRGCLIGCG
jgi:hypothetical protein